MATTVQPRVRYLTEAVGAVIEDVSLGSEVDAGTLNLIRETLFERGVVFFPKQDVTAEQLWSFVAHFGMPMADDSFGTDHDTPEDVRESDLAPTRRGTAVWHTDSSFLANPPKITILRAVKLPPVGGDTCWASMTAAYQAFPEPLRDLLDRLTAVHAIEPPMTRMGGYERFETAFRERHAPQQVHPVVSVHPETGGKALYVTESCTTRIVELAAQQSRHLLAMLFEHIKSPDFNLRWTWTPGDVALWDNRVVQHYAVPDYESERVMQRIVVAGERPVGPRPRDGSTA